jgi:hypothetical protein
VKYFNEFGNWRRPLLPPLANVGILVDIDDGEYVMTILTRPTSTIESPKLFSILRKELLEL